jgi:hypothetical protein
MSNILCKGKKILSLGVPDTYPIQNGQALYPVNSFGWWVKLEDGSSVMSDNIPAKYVGDIYKYNQNELYNNNGVAEIKDQSMIKIEAISKMQQEILESKDSNALINAVLLEITGGEYSTKTKKISDDSIRDWYQYLENVAKFKTNGFNVDDYTLDPLETEKILITPSIFGTVPELPDIITEIVDNL